MQTCSYCDGSLPDRALFCPACAKQVRCRQCRDILENDARACVSCGALLTEVSDGTGAAESSVTAVNGRQNETTAVNTLELRRTTKGSMVRVNFTDYAVSKSTEVLRRVIGIELPFAESQAEESAQRELPLLLKEGQTNGQSPQQPVIDVTAQQLNTQPGVNLDNEERRDLTFLKQVFYRDGNRLVLDDLTLKASTQLDAGRRLVYLFLYAHALEGRTKVPRDEVNEVLKDVGLYDPNVIGWISKAPELALDEDDQKSLIRLRGQGRTEAKTVLTQMQDASFTGQWNLTERVRSRGNKASGDGNSGDKSNKSTRSTKKNSVVTSWLQRWEALGLPVDGHSICNDNQQALLTKGLLGLWAIRRATSDEARTVSGANLVAFMNQAFVVQLDRRNVTRALESKEGQGKVIRRADGYEITPTGITEIEAIALTEKTAKAQKAKAAAKS
jgi:hypothetical protein